jgi:hypothetical protein
VAVARRDRVGHGVGRLAGIDLEHAKPDRRDLDAADGLGEGSGHVGGFTQHGLATFARSMKLLTAILIALALVAAGCGDDDGDEPDQPAQTAPTTTDEVPTITRTEPEPAPAEASEEDEEAVQDVVKKWLLEGGCERMTDKFLDDQLLGLGDNRQERCDLFQKQHTKPQYGEDQIKITEVQVTGTKASLVVGSDNAPDITSKYELVKTGGQWQIDSAEIQ